MTTAQSILLGIVEGLTEFLPVSSTGHMIITSSGLGIAEQPFTKLFTVAVQLGAIFAVVVYYWRKFINLRDPKFYIKLAIAVIPALIAGKLLNDFIDEKLGSPVFIACTLIGGGVVLLFVDNMFRNPTIRDEKNISYVRAFIIGCWQVLSVVLPGLSRSAATIIGGMQQKLTRSTAAEFSFFLAVPTMLAATGYSLVLKKWTVGGTEIKGYKMLTESHENMMALLIGSAVAFVVALLAIRVFIDFVKRYGFRIWGVYRIVLGIAVILIHYFVFELKVV